MAINSVNNNSNINLAFQGNTFWKVSKNTRDYIIPIVGLSERRAILEKDGVCKLLAGKRFRLTFPEQLKEFFGKEIYAYDLTTKTSIPCGADWSDNVAHITSIFGAQIQKFVVLSKEHMLISQNIEELKTAISSVNEDEQRIQDMYFETVPATPMTIPSTPVIESPIKTHPTGLVDSVVSHWKLKSSSEDINPVDISLEIATWKKSDLPNILQIDEECQLVLYKTYTFQLNPIVVGLQIEDIFLSSTDNKHEIKLTSKIKGQTGTFNTIRSLEERRKWGSDHYFYMVTSKGKLISQNLKLSSVFSFKEVSAQKQQEMDDNEKSSKRLKPSSDSK